MSDESKTIDAAPADAVSASEKKPGLLATPGGRIVAIVVGLGVLGIVAGIAVAIVLYVFGTQAADELEAQIENATTSEPGGEVVDTVNAAADAPAPEVPNSEVFTFRDIFVPLLEPLPEPGDATTTSTSSTTTDSVTPTNPGTLYLDGVVTQNGVLMAQLRYNGTSYTLGAGGVIPNSPWQVLRVTTSSVTMLYGDIQVTLSVGEGVTK